MPEYVARAFTPSLDAFTRGYLGCAEWCGLHGDEQHEALDLSVHPTWSSKALEQAREDCEAFQVENAGPLAVYYRERSESSAGHDFWLTRNRHGAGFWDGRVSDADTAERLTDASHVYGESSVWFDERTESLSFE